MPTLSLTHLTSRRQAEDLLIEKAQRDDAFRRELLENARAAIGRALGVDLPPDVRITVLEETDRSLYLVLPARKGSGELSERDLDTIAGGSG